MANATITTRPPTTAPTIAPTGVEADCGLEEGEVEAGVRSGELVQFFAS